MSARSAGAEPSVLDPDPVGLQAGISTSCRPRGGVVTAPIHIGVLAGVAKLPPFAGWRFPAPAQALCRNSFAAQALPFARLRSVRAQYTVIRCKCPTIA